MVQKQNDKNARKYNKRAKKFTCQFYLAAKRILNIKYKLSADPEASTSKG